MNKEFCGIKVVLDNETYNKYKGTLQEQIERLQQENKQLKEVINGLKELYENMALEFNKSEERIYKAIEYIEYNNEDLYTFEPDYDYEEELVDNYEPSNYREDLLEILKGDSNEK